MQSEYKVIEVTFQYIHVTHMLCNILVLSIILWLQFPTRSKVMLERYIPIIFSNFYGAIAHLMTVERMAAKHRKYISPVQNAIVCIVNTLHTIIYWIK